MEYQRLPNVMIIIILPYDPFGKNRMVYTIENQCVEDVTIPYDNGAKKVFLYTKGTEGNPSQALQDMLKYIEKTTDENVANSDIEAIHELVKKLKQSRKLKAGKRKPTRITRSRRKIRTKSKPSPRRTTTKQRST